MDSVLNPAGTELAVLFDNQTQGSLLSEVFGQKYALQVFDTASGAMLRSMNDPGETGQLLDLYWGADRLSLLLFGGGLVSWDATSGNVLDVTATSGVDQCDFLSPTEAFDKTRNVLFAVEGGNVPNICVLDFNTGATNRYTLVKPASATRVGSVALDASGDELWVSFETIQQALNNAGVPRSTMPHPWHRSVPFWILRWVTSWPWDRFPVL